MFISEEIVATNSIFLPRAPSKSSSNPFMQSSRFLVGSHLLFNVSISVLLITLSNDVSTNLGPKVILNQQLPNARGIKISHLNIRSLGPKLDSIRTLLKDQPFDIFTISKTRLNPAILDHELNVPDYSIFGQDLIARENKKVARQFIFVMEFLFVLGPILRKILPLRTVGLKSRELRPKKYLLVPSTELLTSLCPALLMKWMLFYRNSPMTPNLFY